MLGRKKRKEKKNVAACGCGGKVIIKDNTAQKETEKTALDHGANMSTEIKLVYYFQRGKKITKQKSSHILH